MLSFEQSQAVEANMGLVVDYLHTRAPRWLLALYQRDDAQQTCVLGLIQAVSSYDPACGELSTYAEKCMYNSLLYWAPKQKVCGLPRSSGKLYVECEELVDAPETEDLSLEKFRQLAADTVGRLAPQDKRLLDMLMDGKDAETMRAELRYSRAGFYRAKRALFAQLRDIFR
jgi:RNA polymerase sigma factor (sigma-70 family)